MCLLSPSGHRAEHEVARSWTERSGALSAQVGDWERAETLRRRLPSGQLEALHSKLTARAQGEMWVNQPQSWDPLAQRWRQSSLSRDMLRLRGHRPSGREHRFKRQEASGRQPENWFLAGIPRCLRSAQYGSLVRDTPRVHCWDEPEVR